MTETKKALITGITGQDGSYLAEFLLSKGYEIYGTIRRVALEDEKHLMSRILHIKDEIHLIPATLESYASVYNAMKIAMPDEVYHLAAQSYVNYSFEDAFSTFNTNINGTLHVISAMKDLAPNARFYFAASSEMFGKVHEIPQTEETKFHPRSPYGISKVAGYSITVNHREAYNMFACNGILFNHESPRRGYEFVTRKISSSVARIKLGMMDKLELGNLEAKRDWGHAREYVKAMWLMLQQDASDDYVICSGETHSVKEFCKKAFEVVGLDYRDYVVSSAKFYRPAEVDLLVGDCSKAKQKLGWHYDLKFDYLVKEMVEEDVRLLQYNKNGIVGELQKKHSKM